MNIQTENQGLFWLTLFIGLSLALIIQSSFLPLGESYSLSPYLIWPPLLFFFLHHNSLSSLILLFFTSLLSSIYFSLPLLSLFLLYFICFLLVSFVKQIFFSKSPLIFFALTFVISLIFPYLVDLAYDFSIDDLSLSTNLFYLSKAFSTLILSVLLFPFLKRYLQNPSSTF